MTLMYIVRPVGLNGLPCWIQLVIMSSSLAIEKQETMEDRLVDRFNNTCEPLRNVNNKTEETSLSFASDNMTSSDQRLGWCINCTDNGSRTTTLSKYLHFDLHNVSIMYDDQWCADIYMLYWSIFYSCFKLDHLTSLTVFQILTGVYLILPLCIVGCLGNLLSIAVLYRDRKSYNTTNFLLQTLALVDILFLAT